MKHWKRRLYAFLMAAAIMCTMLPTAMAIDFLCPDCDYCLEEVNPGAWSYYDETEHRQWCSECSHYEYRNHSFNSRGVCTVCTYNNSDWYDYCPDCLNYLDATDWVYENSTYHSQFCYYCGDYVYERHSFNSNGICTVCTYNNSNLYDYCPDCLNYLDATDWVYENSTYHSQFCYYCGDYVYERHSFNSNGICTVCTYNNSNLYDYCPDCLNYLDANDWVYENSTYHSQFCYYCGDYVYERHSFNSNGICTICTHNFDSDITVTISQSNGIYYFDDDNTQSGYSVYEYLLNELPSGSSTGNYHVYFSNYSSSVGSLSGLSYSSCALSNLPNVYLSIDTYGTWYADYTITSGSTTVASGTLAIVVESYSLDNIVYTATKGDSVALDIEDFYDFWDTYTDGYGSLNYVRISSVTGLSGTVCYEHSTSESRHNNASGSSFYVNPSKSQKDLSDLTFVPSKSANKYPTGTVTISFTASGTNRSNYTTSASGKIQITYTEGEVEPIVYTSSDNYITLNGSDFDSVYKTATGSTSHNPSYTIKFLDVPKSGTLYRNYTGTNLGNLYNYELTTQNISSLTFSNRSNSTNYIGKVVYIPSNFTTVNDSVRYAAYSGNTLLYWGTINFNTQEVIIEYTCSSGSMKFSASDFFTSSTSMLNAQYIAFGAPSSGKLYKDYANGKGTTVTQTEYFSYSDNFGVSNLSRVTYVPTAGYSGTVEIPFFSTSLSGISLNGKIRITVTAPPTPSFTDVNPNHWATTYINRLYTTGIIKGTSATTFSPNANMKYGEALKMILLAAGYPTQIESGTHWASNYLTLAYNAGIVSTTNIDLDSAVDRDTVATITAKAMGLSYASSVNAGISAPSDSTNGYVYALYNAGIVGGEFVNGVNHFYGSRNINRAEVSKIICNITDYSK